MRTARTLLAASLLLLIAPSFAPMAAASPDDVQACVGYKEGMCEGDAALILEAGPERVDACVIGVAGSCDPYNGHLVRVHAGGDEYAVYDPCYTTLCF